MKHRATVKRNAETGDDGLGHPLPADYEFYSEIPCWVWSATDKLVDNANKVAFVQFFRCIFPRYADITRDDLVTKITDRQGVTIFEGPFEMADAPDVKPDHLEVYLRKVS